MAELLESLWSGLVLGSTYALMAMGLTLVWGGLRMLNLTQGALCMLGAYVALQVHDAGVPAIAGVVVAGLALGAFGALLYGAPIRTLARRPDADNATLLGTFALALILEQLTQEAFGPRNQPVAPFVDGAFEVAGVVISWNSVVVAVAAVAVLLGVAFALGNTRLGLGVRALSMEREGAQLAGINVDRTSAIVLFAAAALAGVSGALLASFYFVSPSVGGDFLLLAIVVTILGGLGSIVGTLWAAYVVGVVQAIVSLYLGVRWALPVLFALIIVTLVVRPGGLAGRVSTERL